MKHLSNFKRIGSLLLGLALDVACIAATEAPTAAQPSRHFDAASATNAWLASVPPSLRAKSDAYFEGGYWLLLWDFLYGAAIMLFLLETRTSARMRDLARRFGRFGWLESLFYWTEFVVIVAVMEFPLAVYEDFLREHLYGLSNQNFASWFRDQVITVLLAVILGGCVFTIVIAIVRRFPVTWHYWATFASMILLVIGMVIGPVYLAPLYNTYKPLGNSAIKDEILSLARENGIAVDRVYEVNASRQSKRVSANVSGLLDTERITLNDNLLNRCSAAAVLAVMGHEMGHCVLHHIYNSLIFASIVTAMMFSILRWGMSRALARRGQHWGVHGAADVAALPLATLIILILGFIFTPVGNTYARTQEYEADIFGLNAARQPDGEAEADLLLGEYRKLDPTPIEEFLFFDHPGGRTRIYAAMRWKAENLCIFDRSLPCTNSPR